MPRLNEKDVNLLCKALQYSKSAYEEAIAAKEAAIRTELAINEFIKEWKNTSEEKVDYNDNKDPGKKKVFWYSVSKYVHNWFIIFKFFSLVTIILLFYNLEYLG